MLKKVTVTGADDTTDIEEMVTIQKEYPFVEWAILVSAGRKSPRFPSMDWIKALSGKGLKLSLHLCGRYVNEILAGDMSFIAFHLSEVWNMFDRVQINTHGISHEADLPGMVILMNNFSGKEFIFQFDNQNSATVDYARAAGVKCSALFDLSHGDGILPSEWPKPIANIPCGYAGGLSPENVTSQLDNIKSLIGSEKIWIDAETHLRTYADHKDIFDLNKVRSFLSASKPYVQ